jgi:hypothetical protein
VAGMRTRCSGVRAHMTGSRSTGISSCHLSGILGGQEAGMGARCSGVRAHRAESHSTGISSCHLSLILRCPGGDEDTVLRCEGSQDGIPLHRYQFLPFIPDS